MDESQIQAAAETIRNAKAMIITAGAGMGIDSGLPDFRGDQGFWNAYPMYAQLGLSFVQAANPDHFETDPHFGWGFYGHRTNIYRDTVPHAGFRILQEWITKFGHNAFVVTSNVDGQFQKAGFADDQIFEVHGSIHYLQCTAPCTGNIWINDGSFTIDESTMRSRDVPKCPRCQRIARPNILMFGDYSWVSKRSDRQERHFNEFIYLNKNVPMVVIEIGAGSAIPTIRHLSENLGHKQKTRVIRINPREPQIQAPHYSFAAGAVEILSRINNVLRFPPDCKNG
ncbi:NAD-dependent protein deacetylase, SIR2 family [Desulfuromusa kysingii]|uniref:protein acetyllysine N-acetyltransferase n=1 Tax=Desulfuromusa kysingii TaxID=37625 RepID=A0A1H4BYX7_9BACT|nr:Sir2 family NAD-dependent protein deacetylase [Desulfuromusa kysingii]SEA53289.1 NAD-dependent protein deacetylase, SIR2 family [Desulfuromusa kysingii]